MIEIIVHSFINIYNLVVICLLLEYLNCLTKSKVGCLNFFIIPFFATTLNFAMQTVFFILYLIYDITENNIYNRSIKMILDSWFYGVLAPASLFVCSMYWTLYKIDKKLIDISNDLKTSEMLPNIYNHMLHTTIIFPVIFQILLNKINCESDTSLIVYFSIFTQVFYLSMIFLNKFINKVWIYGILNTNTGSQKLSIIIIFSLIWYLICVLVNII